VGEVVVVVELVVVEVVVVEDGVQPHILSVK